MEKEETLNFCTAKKRTLQSFVVKKADSANCCSAEKRTLQSLRGTLQNCTWIYYKFRVIARAHVRMFIQSHSRARDHAWITPARPNVDPKSHASQIVTRLLCSSHNHLNHECAVPPPRPQVTPTTTNNPRRPQSTTTG